MIEISEIGTLREALSLAEQTVAKTIKTTLGVGYKVIRAEEDTNSPITPYATTKMVMNTGTSKDTKGNIPIHTQFDPITGIETAVFSNIITVLVKLHKGDALYDASDIFQSLQMKAIHYELFGHDQRIGLRGHTAPQTNNTPIDKQGWESGATFTMTLDVLSKQEVFLGVIEEVKGLEVNNKGLKVYHDNLKDPKHVHKYDIQVRYPAP